MLNGEKPIECSKCWEAESVEIKVSDITKVTSSYDFGTSERNNK